MSCLRPTCSSSLQKDALSTALDLNERLGIQCMQAEQRDSLQNVTFSTALDLIERNGIGHVQAKLEQVGS